MSDKEQIKENTERIKDLFRLILAILGKNEK